MIYNLYALKSASDFEKLLKVFVNFMPTRMWFWILLHEVLFPYYDFSLNRRFELTQEVFTLLYSSPEHIKNLFFLFSLVFFFSKYIESTGRKLHAKKERMESAYSVKIIQFKNEVITCGVSIIHDIKICKNNQAYSPKLQQIVSLEILTNLVSQLLLSQSLWGSWILLKYPDHHLLFHLYCDHFLQMYFCYYYYWFYF